MWPNSLAQPGCPLGDPEEWSNSCIVFWTASLDFRQTEIIDDIHSSSDDNVLCNDH